MYLYLKQKVFSLTEKFTFFDENQVPIFTSKGSFFGMPKRFTIYHGETAIAQITRKMLTFLPKYTLTSLPQNQILCEIKRKFGFKKNFSITAQEGEYMVNGSFFGMEFTLVTPDGVGVASVSKKYISWGDTYEIWVDENRIPPHVMAGIMVAIDNAIHDNK